MNSRFGFPECWDCGHGAPCLAFMGFLKALFIPQFPLQGMCRQLSPCPSVSGQDPAQETTRGLRLKGTSPPTWPSGDSVGCGPGSPPPTFSHHLHGTAKLLSFLTQAQGCKLHFSSRKSDSSPDSWYNWLGMICLFHRETERHIPADWSKRAGNLVRESANVGTLPDMNKPLHSTLGR